MNTFLCDQKNVLLVPGQKVYLLLRAGSKISFSSAAALENGQRPGSQMRPAGQLQGFWSHGFEVQGSCGTRGGDRAARLVSASTLRMQRSSFLRAPKPVASRIENIIWIFAHEHQAAAFGSHQFLTMSRQSTRLEHRMRRKRPI